MKLYSSIIILLLIIQIPLFGQNNKPLYLSDQIEIDSSRLSLTEGCYNTYLKLCAVTAATGLLFLTDNTIRNNIKSNSTPLKNTIMDIGHTYGKFYYSFGLSGALYLTHLITDDRKLSRTGKVLFESLVVSGIASITIKFIFGRSRPYREDGVIKFNWFETKNIFNSLPSGDVITAFTTSTVLSKAINNTYASIALYGLAGLTVYQRIASDNHWFSDTFLGASIGILVGEYFSDLDEPKNDKTGDYMLVPFFSQNYSGLSLTVNL